MKWKCYEKSDWICHLFFSFYESQVVLNKFIDVDAKSSVAIFWYEGLDLWAHLAGDAGISELVAFWVASRWGGLRDISSHYKFVKLLKKIDN